jgi:hypothetical protein
MEHEYGEASEEWRVFNIRVHDWEAISKGKLFISRFINFPTKDQEAHDSIMRGVGSIIRDYVEIGIRGIVFECVDEKVADLSVFWDYQFLTDELCGIDRLSVTSRILEEL